MSSLVSYGMAGIGIAAAIGFVFALSMLNTNTTINANYAKVQEQSEDQNLDSSQSLPMEQQNTEDSYAADQPVDSAGASTPAKSADVPVRQEDLSIIALNDNREVIGEVESGMQFVTNKPVFIQANVVNPSQVMVHDRFIALAVKNDIYDKNASEYAPQQDEKLTSFRGDITANSGIELELYWKPERVGIYTIVLFSTDSFEPVAMIPIEVVDASSAM
jgi:hypothetical protein